MIDVPNNNAMMNSTKKIPKAILAMEDEAPAIPVNPSKPATNEIRPKTTASVSKSINHSLNKYTTLISNSYFY